jgi:hypothetical protein
MTELAEAHRTRDRRPRREAVNRALVVTISAERVALRRRHGDPVGDEDLRAMRLERARRHREDEARLPTGSGPPRRRLDATGREPEDHALRHFARLRDGAPTADHRFEEREGEGDASRAHQHLAP